jgi:hypothetical protein
MKFAENLRRSMGMIDKKSFLVGMLSGALSLAAIGGIIVGGINFYEYSENNSEAAYDVVEEDEVIVESAGVFADSGNPIIIDQEEKYKVEIIGPTGYRVGEDYESAYGMEYYNEDQSIRIEYSIENNMAEDMESYYEFETTLFETYSDGTYSNITTSEIKTMEVNGYTVNYLSLSYTYEETENYTEYCAYVMLDDSTQFMCNIYGTTGEVNEELIKECFKAQLPITQ